MADQAKTTTSAAVKSGETGNLLHKKSGVALWLGGGKRSLEMGWGRGPRQLEGHELVSWFFSRDGI